MFNLLKRRENQPVSVIASSQNCYKRVTLSSCNRPKFYYRSIRMSVHFPALSAFRPCEAYLSKPNNNAEVCLITCIENAIKSATGRYPVVSTSGGTSDGRFFASEGTQVVEVGVPNTTIHQVNEHIHLSDLLTLEDIYADVLVNVCGR